MNLCVPYNKEGNRLQTAGTQNFTYDDEGRLCAKDGVNFSFDSAHRLTQISGPSAAQYAYDGADRRLRAVRNGVVTRYIYDIAGNLIAEADASNTITRYYIYGAGLIAMITPADKVYCYHYNAIGSTIAISDKEQNLVNKYTYAPFGEILNEEEEIPQPFKFVGQHGVMYEETNGLYYMRARYYDPSNGRFISEDPTGFEGGDVNLYAYAGNNPMLLIDPLGLCGGNGTLTAIRRTQTTNDIISLGGLGLLFTPFAPAGAVVLTTTGYTGLTLGAADYFISNNPNNAISAGLGIVAGRFAGRLATEVAGMSGVAFNWGASRFYSSATGRFVSNVVGKASLSLEHAAGSIASSIISLFSNDN